jgi:hypothetical protein
MVDTEEFTEKQKVLSTAFFDLEEIYEAEGRTDEDLAEILNLMSDKILKEEEGTE